MGITFPQPTTTNKEIKNATTRMKTSRLEKGLWGGVVQSRHLQHMNVWAHIDGIPCYIQHYRLDCVTIDWDIGFHFVRIYLEFNLPVTKPLSYLSNLCSTDQVYIQSRSHNKCKLRHSLLSVFHILNVQLKHKPKENTQHADIRMLKMM